MPIMVNIAIATPEIFLLSTICLILLIDLVLKDTDRMVTYLLSQVALLATALLVFSSMGSEKITGLNDMYVRDDLGGVLKVSILLLTAGVFVYARKYLRDKKLWRGEFFLLALFAVLGMMVMASANNLLVVYLGLELLALSMYALVAFNRDDGRSTEAAMKYFVLGAVASGLLLYGFSMLYGLSGKLDIAGVAAYISAQNVMQNLPLLFALVFVVAGISFKFGAVPFHMWVPDVYQGAPTAVTLFLGSVPKVAALAMLLRVLAESLGVANPAWAQMLLVFGLLSVFLGNIVAIAQFNLKRMLAYSTIAHMGFILLGSLSGSTEGYSAALFYTITYAMMAAGGFAILILLGKEGVEAETLDDIKGLNERSPWYAFIMMLLLFSMAGIPPTVGFYAKLSIIQAVMQAGYLWPAIIMVVMSVIGAFYYLRAIKMMYFDKPDNAEPITAEADFNILLGVNGVLMLVLGLFPGTLMGICSAAMVASQL
ncbi:MAG TPA: NADH-quinone oxidoreductase subunit NuoN [Candidatus Thiothrix moscowensis]|nr:MULTISPECIES: NADH-quinone oxidoreductase subunit NuoN [unclassified Thiothrix]MBJ6609028.1 NADH-quinone oxidoreductase subunit NuoN [Candidatus Thiothrix moscowensis]HRJ53364.1 NADH-quinone oxidoreductase subunit NuoN [Candidatus Thiothrix moscowensis]HRJ94927.1 NADH-quinone oxidoreductase subunit NuoN [Candidatus Thiothrix moscowensis]